MSNFENGVGLNSPGFINGVQVISMSSATNNVVAGGTSFSTWGDVLNSTSLSEGDYIVQGDLLYRWRANNGVSGAGNPIPHLLYQLGIPNTLATVAGDNASLTTEGWTHTQSGGITTTDGTRVSISINASVTEQWSVTPSSGKVLYLGGYFSMSNPLASQQQIQIINGTKYCILTKNVNIGTNPEPFVVRSNSSTALRSGEYASSITDATERWIDVIYDPNTTTGQTRIWINHEPWFGCGTSALETGSSLNTVSLLVTIASTGTRDSTMELRNVIVAEEP